MDTSTCPASWYPIHFFNFTTAAGPDVSKYLSWMHFGTGLIFREFWLSHRSNPDSLVGELVLPEVPSWPTTQTALITWIGMMSSMQLGTRKKDVETMSVAEVPAVGLCTHRYFFKKGVLVHVYM